MLLAVLVAASLLCLGALFLPLAVRVRWDTEVLPARLVVDGGLWCGWCGLSAAHQDGAWRLRLLLARWTPRWPSWGVQPRRQAGEPCPPPVAFGPLRRRAGRQPRRPLARLASARRWRHLWPAMRGAAGCIGLHHGSVHGRLGLGDPARTGWAYGLQMLLRPWIPGRLRIDLEPNFAASGFHGRAEFVLHVRVHRLLWSLAAIALGSLRPRVRVRLRTRHEQRQPVATETSDAIGR